MNEPDTPFPRQRYYIVIVGDRDPRRHRAWR